MPGIPSLYWSLLHVHTKYYMMFYSLATSLPGEKVYLSFAFKLCQVQLCLHGLMANAVLCKDVNTFINKAWSTNCTLSVAGARKSI